ncbi:MAG: NYN domain-containing protein [Gemmatimonadetes bacterium]|nr:MAG: NYN domain-containing protein [Gemmatimonadota bacterium]
MRSQKEELRQLHLLGQDRDEKVLRLLNSVIQQQGHTRREVDRLREILESQGKRPRGKSDLERVAVFVDVQNMFYGAKKQFNARLDYAKLLDAAVGKRRLIQATAYVVQTPEIDQSAFVSMLQHRNYTVKTKDLRLRADGSAKGDWDMGMALDMLRMAERGVDVISLVSGDGDFVDLVNLIKTKGPKVEVFAFTQNIAVDLREAADHFYAIGTDLLLGFDTVSEEKEAVS